MPSIVDPKMCRGGAWAATRGLMRLIELGVDPATVDCIPLAERSRLRHRVRQVRCVAGAIVGNTIPAKIRFTTDDAMLQRVQARMRDAKPDLVIINGSDLLWLLPHIPPSIPVVIVVHNIEHELYAAQIESVSSRVPGVRALLERDLRSLELFEWNAMREVTGAIFLSGADKATALRNIPALDAIAVPPVFDYEPQPRHLRTTGPLRVGMFADFTWWPNRDALKWFLDGVWPHVEGDVELRLFGYASESMARGVPRVRSYGFIEEPAQVFAECDLMIAPAVTGAGVKVKVAEALYNRVPVVASPLALRGLETGPLSTVQSCTTNDEWIAFLSSSAARALADSSVDDTVALRFAPPAASSLVAGFLLSAAETQGRGKLPMIAHPPNRSTTITESSFLPATRGR